MKKKEKTTIIISIIVIILAIGSYFTFKFFLEKDLEKQKEELQETIDKYGTVEKESIMTTVSKFNTEVKDNGSEGLNPAMEDYFAVENNEYWYGLSTGVYLFIKPVTFTENRDNDIVDFMGIYYYKDQADEDVALEYFKHLIKANNYNITEDEAKDLIDEAKKLAPSGKTANNGKGISVGVLEKDNHYEYQVVRLYK